MAAPSKLSSFLKAGFQGNTGTGKTTTAALLLLGISVERHAKAPVLVFDTEPGWQFVKPMYDAEGVELLIRTGRHFKGLIEALREAKARGCCGFAADSLTHPWTELLQSFAGSDGRVPMHKFNQIKQMWNAYVVEFMDAAFHSIACGRLQWEMLTVEQETGGYDVVRGDSKMKAGGGESFGYEPHLLVEFTHEQKRSGGKGKKAVGGGKVAGLEYVGFVLKDRSRALNGQELRFQDFRDYKPKGYGPVYTSFLPHLLRLDSITGSKIGQATSAEIIPEGNSDFYRAQQRHKIALEEVEGLITTLWPGQDAKSKKIKASVIFVLFNTRSWLKVESLPLPELEIAQRALAQYEHEIAPGGALASMPKDDEQKILMAIGEMHTSAAAEAHAPSTPSSPPDLPPLQAEAAGASDMQAPADSSAPPLASLFESEPVDEEIGI